MYDLVEAGNLMLNLKKNPRKICIGYLLTVLSKFSLFFKCEGACILSHKWPKIIPALHAR